MPNPIFSHLGFERFIWASREPGTFSSTRGHEAVCSFIVSRGAAGAQFSAEVPFPKIWAKLPACLPTAWSRLRFTQDSDPYPNAGQMYGKEKSIVELAQGDLVTVQMVMAKVVEYVRRTIDNDYNCRTQPQCLTIMYLRV